VPVAGGALPSLERRHIEDRLGETLYGRTPILNDSYWPWPIRCCAAAS